MNPDWPPPRFGMTRPPQPGGKLGDYEEKLAQWFLEDTFFADFVYRNPPGKGGKGELADAVVLFGDVALLVQVKAQSGGKESLAWVRKEAKKALKQLTGTNRMLVQGHVRDLVSQTFGTIRFDRDRYHSRIGLIILAHESEPFDPEEAVPELRAAGFRVHVFSLRDFVQITNIFDTAADLIVYLDLRDDMKSILPRRVHEEPVTLRIISDNVEAFFGARDPDIDPAVLDRTVRQFRLKARGDLLNSPDWKYGLAIDDIIARLHDRDPNLPWNQGAEQDVMRVAEQLAWLDRARRIALGKRAVALATKAQDGRERYFSHFQRITGVTMVFLATTESRERRLKYLQFLVGAAMMKYGAKTGVGIATEPIGAGRSYDVAFIQGELSPEFKAMLVDIGDPFSADSTQLIP